MANLGNDLMISGVLTLAWSVGLSEGRQLKLSELLLSNFTFNTVLSGS